MTNKFPVAGPSITQLEVDYVVDAVTNGWYEQCYDYIKRFEREFAKATNRKFAFALPNCTSGLHLALLAAGVAPGDEVIVPDLTWIASVAPVRYVGATPVFAEVESGSWCISPQSVLELITKKTKAVIVVDLYGGMPDFDSLSAICRTHGLYLIEDAAEAVGSSYKNMPAGSFGDMSAFSFHGTKTLTTGEGGMLLTNDKALADKVHVLSNHGRPIGDKDFICEEIGYKYKMSNLQAALGLAQLERLQEVTKKKRSIFHCYLEELNTLEGISLNAEPENVYNSYWMSFMVWDESFSVDKIELLRLLREQGLDARPFFDPLSSSKAFSDVDGVARARERNVISYRLGSHGINLPSALRLTEKDVKDISKIVIDVMSLVRS